VTKEGGVDMSNFLVLGYGNPLRGDDTVGRVVARAIANWHLHNVKVLTLHQLAPELADDIARVDIVYFIDACMDITLEHPQVTEIQSSLSTVTVSHFSSPRDLLVLTKQLYNAEPRAYLIEMPAESFELSEGLSVKAEEGVREGLEYLRKALSNNQAVNQTTMPEKFLQHL
jgi:hydrogenase maturation protease